MIHKANLLSKEQQIRFLFGFFDSMPITCHKEQGGGVCVFKVPFIHDLVMTAAAAYK